MIKSVGFIQPSATDHHQLKHQPQQPQRKLGNVDGLKVASRNRQTVKCQHCDSNDDQTKPKFKIKKCELCQHVSAEPELRINYWNKETIP